MKNYLLAILLFVSPTYLKAQQTITISKDTTTYDAANIERQPEFPGGKDKLYKFISKTLRYPADAREHNIQGNVELRFVVNTDGTLSDIKVSKSLAADLDQEAIRVMKLSPKWIPAKKGQDLVNCSVTLPISFILK